MRKRTIQAICYKVTYTLILMFPLFHFFFFGLAGTNQQGLPDYSTATNIDTFFEEQYSFLSPYDSNGDFNNTPAGLLLGGIVETVTDFDLLFPVSNAIYSMINWAVYLTVIRVLLAVILFIPHFALKMLNRFSLSEEVI